MSSHMPAILLLVLLMSLMLPQAVQAAELSADVVEKAVRFGQAGGKAIDPAMIRLQVLLDRSRFSPGVIDGLDGENVSKAIAAYKQANGLAADGKPDEKLLATLATEDGKPVLQRYTVLEKEVTGPFLKEVPQKREDMTKPEHLSYTSPRELVAEKFHMDEDLLAALNPGADFSQAGTQITVAQVKTRGEKDSVTRIEIDKGAGSLSAFDDKDDLVAFYPAAIGSSDMPSPTGTHKVRAIAPEPIYDYNPKELNFSGVKAEGLLEIAAGPNNPVGTVWIDLTEPTYGIHGTPEPSR